MRSFNIGDTTLTPITAVDISAYEELKKLIGEAVVTHNISYTAADLGDAALTALANADMVVMKVTKREK